MLFSESQPPLADVLSGAQDDDDDSTLSFTQPSLAPPPPPGSHSQAGPSSSPARQASPNPLEGRIGSTPGGGTRSNIGGVRIETVRAPSCRPPETRDVPPEARDVPRVQVEPRLMLSPLGLPNLAAVYRPEHTR
jgi:hypothetical protein